MQESSSAADAAKSVKQSSRHSQTNNVAAASDYLFEVLVCDLHWCAMQVASVAVVATACGQSHKTASLRTCRYLLHDDMMAMRLALRYSVDIGISSEISARLDSLYVEIGRARAAVSPLVQFETLSNSQRDSLKNHSSLWRGVAKETANAIEGLGALTKIRLNPTYTADANLLLKFLRRAASGVLQDLDDAGVVHPPRLAQRRNSPRLPVSGECVLILPTGQVRAELLDVSRTGLGVTCSQRFSAGQEIVVALNDGRRFNVTVARQDGAKLGLTLKTPLRSNDALLNPARTAA